MAENVAVNDRGPQSSGAKNQRRQEKKVSQSRQIGRSAGRCHWSAGFAAIINIERGELDPPCTAALAIKVCQIVTCSS